MAVTETRYGKVKPCAKAEHVGAKTYYIDADGVHHPDRCNLCEPVPVAKYAVKNPPEPPEGFLAPVADIYDPDEE